MDSPASLSDIISDLRGFGIEDFEEVLSLDAGGKTLKIKLSNIPTEDDIISCVAVEGTKGYVFFQTIKAEILSRSISWINGVSLRDLKGADRLVTDTDGKIKDIQVVLRGLIKGWGMEIMQILWKVLMVHSQRIEDRLLEKFPDAAILTAAEQKYRDQIEKEMNQLNDYAAETVRERAAALLDMESEDKPTPEVE